MNSVPVSLFATSEASGPSFMTSGRMIRNPPVKPAGTFRTASSGPPPTTRTASGPAASTSRVFTSPMNSATNLSTGRL